MLFVYVVMLMVYNIRFYNNVYNIELNIRDYKFIERRTITIIVVFSQTFCNIKLHCNLSNIAMIHYKNCEPHFLILLIMFEIQHSSTLMKQNPALKLLININNQRCCSIIMIHKSVQHLNVIDIVATLHILEFI